MEEKSIVVIRFETGDSDFPYWDVAISIKEKIDIKQIEDLFASYVESDKYSDDEEFEDTVENVMNETGLHWEFESKGLVYILTI